MTENGLFLKARDISVPEKALKLLVNTRDYEYIKFRFIIVGSDMKLDNALNAAQFSFS